MKLLDTSGAVNPRDIRRRLGMNQHQFWSMVGVTQSGGSRYESGRSIPKAVRELLRLVHVERLDLGRLKRNDLDVIDYLREHDPNLLRQLRKAARSHTGRSR